MSRLLVSIVVILLVVVGGLALLASRAKEQPTKRMEKTVELTNLAS